MANVMNNDFEDIVMSYQQLLSATNSVKNTVTTNRDLTKQIIRQNTARLLDALRSRESWLLDQADLLCQSKIDLLQGRRELINRAIGCYDKVKIDSSQIEGLQAIKDDLKGQIGEVEAFVNQQQKLAINGCIKFCGGTEQLIKQLSTFGKVDACNGQSDCQCFDYVRRVALETPLMHKMDGPAQFDDRGSQWKDSDTPMPTAIEECIPHTIFNSRIPDPENFYQMKTFDNSGRKRKSCCNKTCICTTEASFPLNDNQLSYKKWLQCKSSLQDENKVDGVSLQYNCSRNFSDSHDEMDVVSSTDPSHGGNANAPQLAVENSNNSTAADDTGIWLAKRDPNLQNVSSSANMTTMITLPFFYQENDIKKWLAESEESNNQPSNDFNIKHETELIDQWCISYDHDPKSEQALSYTFNFPYDSNIDLNIWLAKRSTSEERCRDSLELITLEYQKYEQPQIMETTNNNNSNEMIDVKENDDSLLWLAKSSFTGTTETQCKNDLPEDIAQYFNRVLSEDSSRWLRNKYTDDLETITAADESNAVVEELQHLSLSSSDQQLPAMPKEYTDFNFNWDTSDNANMYLWLANY